MTISFDKIPWFGALALTVSVLPGIYFLGNAIFDPPFSFSSRGSLSAPPLSSLEIKLPLSVDFAALSVATVEGLVFFSVDPVRPDSHVNPNRFQVRLGSNKQIKRVELPVRIDLAFTSSGALQFSDGPSSLWLDCEKNLADELIASLSYQDPDGKIVRQAEWNPPLQETAFQSSNEFPQGSAFRELGDARWWGQDLLKEKNVPGASVQRLEIGPHMNGVLVDCSLKDWIVFKDNKWQKIRSLEESEGLPIAHIKSIFPQSLEIEGWSEASHIRLKLPLAILPAMKTKAEELFSQLRVRSEKQMSCMLDKQCLVLRPGDWVLKSGSRWKTLRKKEEKEAVLEGVLVGDLFILDRIDAKSSVKNISGSYFAPGRTQSIPIEYAQKTQKRQARAR